MSLQTRLLSRSALIGALPLLLLAGGAASQEAGKVRVAVTDFQNNTPWWEVELGAAAADQLASHFVRSGEFSVIERDELQTILDEQQLGQSGAVDPATAGRIGELLGVQVIVTGSISKFSIDEKRVGIGVAAVSYTEAESVLDVRVVDTRTGEILLMVEGSGKKRMGGLVSGTAYFDQKFDLSVAQDALRPAVEEAVQKIVDSRSSFEHLAPVLPDGEIVGMNEEGSFYIDQGESLGIQVGQLLDVFRVVDEVRDSDGNLLDVLTDRVGLIEVTRVLSQSSVCQIVEGTAQEGDTVRPRS